MASHIRCLNFNLGQSVVRCTRRQSSTLSVKLSPFPELDLHFVELRASLLKKVAGIRTLFDNHEIDDTEYISAGVCVDPTLVLTSARAVGRVGTVRNSLGSPLHKAYIGSSAALFSDIVEPVKLAPVAVSFGSDLAVLKAVGSPPLPVVPTAESPAEKGSLLMAISYDQEDRWGMSAANVRAVGQKTVRAEAPWPLDDGAAWIEHDWLVFPRGPPSPNSVAFAATPKEKKVSGALTKVNGSPWFNMYGELVGVASWVLRDDPACFSVGYAAPLSNIWPLLQYAKAKGPHEPLVMDTWIKTQLININ